MFQGPVILRHADAGAEDAAGNTPGHLAAMHANWVSLSALIQSAEQPVDVTAANHAGLTIQHIMQRHNQGEQPRLAGEAARSGSGSDSAAHGSSSLDSAGGRPQAAGAAAAAAADGGGVDAAWRARLAEEMSDDEGGWGGLSGAGWGAAAPPGAAVAEYGQAATRTGAAAPAADEDDDEAWADRLWQDMQDHRRSVSAAAASAAAARSGGGAAFAGFGGGAAARDAAAQERQRKADAAAAESARILKEEQAKDSNWRAAMMQQIEQAAAPNRREAYESKWAALDAWPKHKPIAYKDIPWPPAAAAAAAAAAGGAGRLPGRQQHTAGELQLDPQQLRALLFGGAAGPDAMRLALRRELMRWHPDKFGARFGSRLAAGDKEAVLAGVQAVAQQLTALKQS
ncbi:hypothetical protein COO60DRAFT_1644158 [Scenedesmus sp. NREL 46B-D3]|nr:hypothetical protein COO60DRAFT_1644158 [Scenedesmus sp. NREL 46B-D3]